MSESLKSRTPAGLSAGVLLLIGAVVVLAACSPADNLDRARATVPPPTPTFTLLPMAPSYLAIATFRGEDRVALADGGVAFEIGEATYAAPLADGPSSYEEPGGTTVTQATYTLNQDTWTALTSSPADSVTVQMPVGDATLAFPFQRGDVME
ncbi:MAG: hypothetical protein AAGF99_06615 [Bacteroidota bacterium]